MTLIIQNLARDFRSQWAVRDLSTSIDYGTVAAVLGANGAGKSTLLQLIAGWLPASSGRIQVEGYTLRINSDSVRRRLMLLGEPSAAETPIVEMIGRALSDYQIDRPEMASEVANWFERLDMVGTYGKSLRHLSKGQRYKISMICLFLVRPKIWLLDEPFSAGLDAGGLNILESEISDHAKSGGVVVFSSQWPEHANRLANQTLVLHEGRLVCDQSAGEKIPKNVLLSAPDALHAVLSGLDA